MTCELADSVVELSRPQLAVFDADARYRVVIAGRRFGKTFLGLLFLLQRATRPGKRCWYVAPTYRQAKTIAWEDLKRLIPPAYLARKPNESELTLQLTNGSEISLKGAENPDSLRGPGLDGLVLDEFAFMKPVAWTEVLRPMLSDREGDAMFTTTPAGHGWAYDIYLRGLSPDEPEWASWTFTTLQGGRVSESEVEAARRDLDPRTFRQEYEASFETLAGRVYSNFDRLRHVDHEVEDAGGTLLVGMDFNVNPMSAALATRVGDECHFFDCIEMMTSNTEEMATELRARYPDRDVLVCPDPSGKARRSSAPVGRTDFTILERAGFKVSAQPGAIPVVDRINNTQAMLLNAEDRVRVRVHPRCEALVRSWDGLTYKPDTSQPDKGLGLDHMADAADYLLWDQFNVLDHRVAKVVEFRWA